MEDEAIDIDLELQIRNIEQQSRIKANVLIAKNKCQTINKYIICMIIYVITQLIIVLKCLIIPSTYDYNPIGTRYLWTRLIQYLFHLYFLNKIRVNNSNFISNITISIQDPAGLLLIYMRLQAYVDESQYNMWGRLTSENQTLYKLNQSIYFVFFIIGNIYFLNDITSLPLWIFIVQLILGWILTTALFLFLTIFCILVPIAVGYAVYAARQVARRQLQTSNAVQQRVQLFSSLKDKPNQPCFICLENYNNDDLVVQLSCNPHHIFHAECIQPWIQSRTNCPVCRAEIE